MPEPAHIAEKLRVTTYAAEVETLAESILAHRFPILGITIETGPKIDWRRDYMHGKSTGTAYFRRIRYLDFERAGDHKIIWELNRHQHLVLLAQAHLLGGNPAYLDEIWNELESWIGQNPFLRSVNWASALEVAFRALSWIWIDHLAGDRMPPQLRQEFLTQLYAHGLHLENNLSIYFSPNTHLLGEAVALHALGMLFSVERWREKSASILDEQVESQVREDGCYFEQSTYYHVYALDMLLFHALLRAPNPEYRRKLEKMADLLNELLGPSGEIPFFGDDDGGRFFHPFGKHSAFGRATVATCAKYLHRDDWGFAAEDLHSQAAWWLGETEGYGSSQWAPRLFPDSGLAVMHIKDRTLVADAGSFGPFASGHSHADTLSFTLRSRDEEILIDPGTCTYMADARQRDLFRGTAMHNTVRIDGLDQADPVNPFRWANAPEAFVEEWKENDVQWELHAECRYRGFTHRRSIAWAIGSIVVVVDEIEGPPGEHLIEQFWHAGAPVIQLESTSLQIGKNVLVMLSGAGEVEEGGNFGWRSQAFAAKIPAPVIRVSLRTSLPYSLTTALVFTDDIDAASANVVELLARVKNSKWSG